MMRLERYHTSATSAITKIQKDEALEKITSMRLESATKREVSPVMASPRVIHTKARVTD